MNKKEGERLKPSSQDVKNTSEEDNSKSTAVSKKIMLDAVLKKIEYYSNKNTVTDLDLYYLFKEFFREYLELKYEFSFDELLAELDKIYLEPEKRTQLVSFINKIKTIEYSDEPFKEDKVKEFLKEFLLLSKSLVKFGDVKHITFWDKLKQAFKSSKQNSSTKDVSSDSVEDFSSNNKDNLDNTISLEPVQEKENKESKEPQKNTKKNKKDKEKNLDNITSTEFLTENSKVSEQPQESAESLDKYKSNISENKESEKKEEKIQDKVKAQSSEKISWTAEPAKDNKYSSEKKYTANDFTKEVNLKSYDKSPAKVLAENTEEKSKKSEKPADKKEKKKNKQEEKQQNKKIKEDKKQNKKTITNKTKENSKKTPQKKEEVKKKSSSEEDIFSLIEKAKKATKKKDLVELYKKIHKLYEKSNPDIQSKAYNSLMEIYKKIAKSK